MCVTRPNTVVLDYSHPCGSLSFFLAAEGDKGVPESWGCNVKQIIYNRGKTLGPSPLAGVVDVGHSTELLKLALDVPVGHVLVDPVHKEFAPLLRHYDGVWCNSARVRS